MDLKTYLAGVHKRCLDKGMHTDAPFVVKQFIPEYELKEKQNQYSSLFNIACSVLDTAFNPVKDVPILIAITDNTPAIVHVFGDSEFVKNASDVGIQPGAIMKESYVGINAPLAALELEIPVSILGPDHFFTILHKVACYSTPIRDINKDYVATVSLLTPLKYANPYILGILSVSQIAIEREWEQIINKNN